MNAFNQLIIFILGLCFGSFANVCIYRLPLHQSLVKPRSRCPHCQRSLRWRDNIPLFSFIFLGARCGFCRHPISRLYPLGEAGFALAFWLTLNIQKSNPVMAAAGGILIFFLWVICFIDLKYRLIPDPLSLGLLAAGLVFSPWNTFLGNAPVPRVLQSFAGALFAFSLMFLLAWGGEKLFRREALGGGDIKFMAALGAFLGWRGVWETLFLASVLGTILALCLMALKRAGRGSYLPFGPFLAVAAWIVWLSGENYLSSFVAFVMSGRLY